MVLRTTNFGCRLCCSPMKCVSHGAVTLNVALRLQINKTANVRATYIQALSCNHYFSGKVIGVTCSECVFVD